MALVCGHEAHSRPQSCQGFCVPPLPFAQTSPHAQGRCLPAKAVGLKAAALRKRRTVWYNPAMLEFLILMFLFFAGSLLGWALEVVWRKFFSKNNPEHRWLNPGFLHGPYLPLYGLSLCLLFSLSFLPVASLVRGELLQRVTLFALMALCITALEYVGGLIFIKGMKIKLWDYSNCRGNIQGIICPQYTFYWWLLSGVYYFLIHPKIISWLYWFTNHLAFCLVVGFFYGVFTVDLCYTFNIAAKIRAYAAERRSIVHYEHLKAHIQQKNEEQSEKRHFLFPLKSERRSLAESLRSALDGR